MVPHARSSRLVAAAGVILLGGAGLAPAQERDAAADFRAQLEKLLDRWNDDAPADRLAKAIELCERRLRADATDPDVRRELAEARLELGRFKLAKGDADGAQADALRAEQDLVSAPARAQQARALYLVAYGASANDRMAALRTDDERKKADVDFQAKFVQLFARLVEVAGDKDAATRLVRDEQERVRTARTLDWLGKPAPRLDRKDTDGTPFRLDAWLGKVVLVDFWAAGSRPYRDELPATLAVHARWKERGLEAVGVSLDNDRALLDQVVKEHKVPWKQLFSGKGLADETAATWGVDQIPRRYLVDHDGKVRYVDVRGDGLAAAVKQLVERAEKAGPLKRPADTDKKE